MEEGRTPAGAGRRRASLPYRRIERNTRFRSVLLLRAKAAYEARGKRREKEQTPKIGAKLAAVHSRNAKTQKTPSDFGHPF